MDSKIKVAVVRGHRRRGAVAEALALIADDLRACVEPDSSPVVVPNLDNPARPWMCTHRDTLAAMTDALMTAGATSIRVAGGKGQRPRPGHDTFDRLGYRAELWGRPARFLNLDATHDDLDHDDLWTTVEWTGPGGEPILLKLCSRVAAARCRVVLGVARTHGLYRVGLGLTDLTGVFQADDRFLPGMTPAGNRSIPFTQRAAVLAPWRGEFVRAWLRLRTIAGGLRLTGSERRWLEWVDRSTRFLVALAALLKPRISLIDGFSAVQGDGPIHGRRVNLGTVIAGTDPVAVDAVAATIMGFEPGEIAYVRQAEAMGLGTADLSAITIVGDSIAVSRRAFRRHSADRLLGLVSTCTGKRTVVPSPHFGSVPARSGAEQAGRPT